jgi:hypothetical protein
MLLCCLVGYRVGRALLVLALCPALACVPHEGLSAVHSKGWQQQHQRSSNSLRQPPFREWARPTQFLAAAAASAAACVPCSCYTALAVKASPRQLPAAASRCLGRQLSLTHTSLVLGGHHQRLSMLVLSRIIGSVVVGRPACRLIAAVLMKVNPYALAFQLRWSPSLRLSLAVHGTGNLAAMAAMAAAGTRLSLCTLVSQLH